MTVMMEAYELKGKALGPIHRLSFNRFHRKKETIYNISKYISVGVPHGSSLGPLLLNISIFFSQKLKNGLCNFAEDKNICAND